MEGKWDFISINSSIYSGYIYSSVVQENYSMVETTAERDNS